MQVHVEFFGVPRSRVGCANVVLEFDKQLIRLTDVWQALADRFPQFATDCLENGTLRPAYTANLNGQRFVSNQGTPILPDASLLVMSTDAGG